MGSYPMWDLGAEGPGLLSVNELTRLQRQPSSHSFYRGILTQLFHPKRARLAFTCSHVSFIWNVSKLYAIYLINLRQKFVQFINFLYWFLKTSYVDTSADERIPTLGCSWSPVRCYGHLLLCWCLTGKAKGRGLCCREEVGRRRGAPEDCLSLVHTTTQSPGTLQYSETKFLMLLLSCPKVFVCVFWFGIFFFPF